MAKRGKAGEKPPADDLNDFDVDTAQEFFDRLDEINDRMRADAASGRGDMNAVYDEAVQQLDITKESLKFLWSRHAAERRFRAKAQKMDKVDRKALDRFAKAMDGTPFGAWAKEASTLSDEFEKASAA